VPPEAKESEAEEPAVEEPEINEVGELEVGVHRLYDSQLDQDFEVLIQNFHFYCPAAMASESLDTG
jgi:hypothetical protein